MCRLGVAVLVAALLAVVSSADAATFTVTDASDAPLASPAGATCVSTEVGGGCTLRAAVQAADNAGGTNVIMLPSGRLKLTIVPPAGAAGSDADDPAHGDLDVLNHDSLTITGAGSGAPTTIDANEIDRAFAVQTGGSLTLANLAVENGNPALQSTGARNGGAIYSNGGLAITGGVTLHDNSTFNHGEGGALFVDTGSTAFSLTNAAFADNSAEGGGAIYFDGGSLPFGVNNSTFTGNQAISTSGGAIVDNGSGAFTVTNSSFSYNNTPTPGTTTSGGAIYEDAAGSSFTVTGSTFDHNASDVGGAIDDEASSGATIGSSTFTANTATLDGALVIDNASTAANSLADDEFDGNRSGRNGGGLAAELGSLTITATTFAGNRAGSGGGLAVSSGQALSMTNSTVSGNHASAGGGGMSLGLGPFTLTNDTIALNVTPPGHGGGVAFGPGPAFPGPTGVVNAIVADNTGGDCAPAVAAPLDSGNNLDSDGSCFGALGVSSDKTMVDPLVSDAAANGGPVKTDALATGSKAIDAANAAKCPATDARGVPRPQGGGCDIGSFEASQPVATIALPLNGSTFTQGAVVKATYACSEAGLTSLIASCTGSVPSGQPIDTTTPGSHHFTVTALDKQGLVVTAGAQYTVVLPPPPNTTITSHHISGDTVTIRFKGIGGSGALHFMCRLGTRGAKFKPCASPRTYTHLPRGKHTVSVKAVDSAGQPDPTPATLHFKIKRKR